MKALPLIIMALCFSVAYGGDVLYHSHGDPLYPLVRNASEFHKQPARRLEWNRQMDSIPDVNARLIELLKICQRQSDDNGVNQVALAIMARDKFEAVQVARLFELAKDIRLPEDASGRGGSLGDGNLLIATMKVLEGHPSPEHEALALQWLDNERMERASVKLLSEIGGLESWEKVRKKVDERRARYAKYLDWIGDEMAVAKDRMKSRLMAEGKLQAPLATPVSKSLVTSSSPSPGPPVKPKGTSYMWIIAITVLAAAALPFWLIPRRRR